MISLSFKIYLNFVLNPFSEASQLFINLIKIILHEKENPSKIHNNIARKYFMSLTTDISISIINANSDNARK